jgi:predicted DNA-binding transcriptional regulator AlpA
MASTKTQDELLTIVQVLDELGDVSRRTFYRWREVGRAPAGIKLPNGEIRIWRSELLAWLETLREAA